MELEVFNKNFERIKVIDQYESLIWTDRFYEYGDFELYLPMDIGLLKWLEIDNYLYLKESKRFMIILNLQTTTDVEQGDHLIVTGRSLESILERRCIFNDWNKQEFVDKTIPEIVETLVTQAFIETSDERKIPNFKLIHTEDPNMPDKKISIEYNHENLYEAIHSLCSENRVGFKIDLNEDLEFEFSLYKGIDRSYRQTDNTYVIFSPQFDNIIDSEYVDETADYRNVCYAAGKEESNRKKVVVGDATGLDRREYYYDVSDIGSDTANAVEKLKEKGNEELRLNHKRRKEFNGQVDASRIFVYGKDFFMGDIVQAVDSYGLQGATYVTEMIFSENESGIEIYPTFDFVDDDEFESTDKSDETT